MILVTGAAGNVGGEVVRTLQEGGEKVRVLTRRPDAEWAGDVEVAVGDLTDPPSLRAALTGVTKAYLLLVLPGIADARPIVRTVHDAGVQHVVLMSSIRAASEQDSVLKFVNLAAEQAVQESGLEWTVLRGGTFMSNTVQWAPSIRTERVVRAHGGGFRSSAVDPRDVGAVAGRILLDSEAHRGRKYLLTGSSVITVTEQIEVLGELLGEKIAFHELPAEVVRTVLIEQSRYPAPIADSLISMYRNEDKSLVLVDPTVGDILDRPPRTFHEWAADHIGLFR